MLNVPRRLGSSEGIFCLEEVEEALWEGNVLACDVFLVITQFRRERVLWQMIYRSTPSFKTLREEMF